MTGDLKLDKAIY